MRVTSARHTCMCRTPTRTRTRIIPSINSRVPTLQRCARRIRQPRTHRSKHTALKARARTVLCTCTRCSLPSTPPPPRKHPPNHLPYTESHAAPSPPASAVQIASGSCPSTILHCPEHIALNARATHARIWQPPVTTPTHNSTPTPPPSKESDAAPSPPSNAIHAASRSLASMC